MSNQTNVYINGAILVGFLAAAIFLALVLGFKGFFSVDAATAANVIVRLIFFVLGYGFLAFFTRRFFEVTLIAIPLSYLWLQPVFQYHAIQALPNVPFALMWQGQILGLFTVSVLCFAIWYIKAYAWKEIWE